MMNISNQSPLRWPDGWLRTRIGDRKAHGGWKKPFSAYRDAIGKELGRMGAEEIIISFNPAPSDRQDCGVAVYFSKIKTEDYSWQDALGLDSPAPTVEQIDDAYRKLAMLCHPDRGGDIELFKKLGEHRANAKAWVLGTQKHEHEYVIAIDRFNETRLNAAAIRLSFAALRQLERVGAPAILERTFRGFKTALPAYASKEAVGV